MTGSFRFPSGCRQRGHRAGSSCPKPARFEYLGSEVLTEIVPPRLVADEQQPIGQHANPLAIDAEELFIHLENHHTPSRTTKCHAAPYMRAGSLNCTLDWSKTCLRSSTK